jgi:hypothetical protein
VSDAFVRPGLAWAASVHAFERRLIASPTIAEGCHAPVL